MSNAASPGGPRVLVTGANGFLAGYLMTSLRESGIRVRGTLRSTDGCRVEDGVELVQASLADRDSLQRACDGVDVVFHVAAAMGGSGSALVHTNVVGTRNLLAAAEMARVGRFVNVSSLAVYDAEYLRTHSVITERSPIETRPGRRDPYCYSKVMQERVAIEYAERGQIELVTVRPGVIYGREKLFLGTRIGLHYGPVLIRMGGRRRLPYTFVENCADALRMIGMSPIATGAYNVVDDDVPTAHQLIRSYRQRGGKAFVVRVPRLLIRPAARAIEWYHDWSGGQLPAIMTTIDADTLWRNVLYPNDRLKEHVGWKQRVGLSEALDRVERGSASR